MKKLLIVSRSTVFQNKSGGLETQLKNLINFLKDTYKVTVLTTALEKSSKVDQKKEIEGVSYIFLANTVPGEYGYSLYESLFWQVPFKKNFKALNSNFKSKASNYFNKNLKGHFDTIISQSSSAQNFNLGDEKLILINHGTTLNEIKNRWFGLNREQTTSFIKDFVRFIGLDLPVLLYEYFINNNLLFSKANKIVLISDRLKIDFDKQHFKFSSKTVVIPNWIDIEKFSPKTKNKDFTVVYFGRIDFEKGLKEFVEVAKNVPNAKFHVFGDGPDKEAFIKISNLANLKYHGSVTNEEVATFLSKSQLFLFLTKRKEGMPMSILEAMSSGCAVITTLKDKAMVKLNGYLVVESAYTAEENLRALLYNKVAFKKASITNRNYAILNFSAKSVAKKYIEII